MAVETVQGTMRLNSATTMIWILTVKKRLSKIPG